MLSIAIVEDTEKHIVTIKNQLALNKNYQIVTTAPNGFEFASYCLQAKTLPQIALVDVQMNIMDGLALVDFLQQFFPSIKCIGITSFYIEDVIIDMVTCGAVGMVAKVFAMSEANQKLYEIEDKFAGLNESIVAAMNNTFYLDFYTRSVMEYSKVDFNREVLVARRLNQIKANATFDLTEKERMITMLCASSSTKLDVIAKALYMDIKTLEKCLTMIYRKLNIVGRLELTHFCISHSIIYNSRST